jgi:RNA methyltransferase, TrmH family
MKHITSRDNTLFKQLLKLAQSSRERKKTGRTVLDGIHLIEVYAQSIGLPQIVAVSKSGAEHREVQSLLAKLKPLDPVLLSDALFHELSGLQTPVGIAAIIATPPAPSPPSRMDFCLLLEDIQDPGNLGSILRTAAAAECKHVFTSHHNVFAWSPRVIRAAMGAHFLLSIYEHQDLVEVVRRFSGKVLATAPSGARPIHAADLRGDLALMIGNEGAGLSSPLLREAHETVTIPLVGMESLNVAAATAICFYERARQLSEK